MFTAETVFGENKIGRKLTKLLFFRLNFLDESFNFLVEQLRKYNLPEGFYKSFVINKTRLSKTEFHNFRLDDVSCVPS